MDGHIFSEIDIPGKFTALQIPLFSPPIRMKNKNHPKGEEVNLLFVMLAWYPWRVRSSLEPALRERCGIGKDGKKDLRG